jgi:hypothetical protein
MTDRREQILQRLLAILVEVAPTNYVVARDRGELPPEKRPGITLLDANETAQLIHKQARGRFNAPPTKMEMTPQITLAMDTREPRNVNIGEDMNTQRVAILKAIFKDTQLADLMGSNGDMRLVGCTTDMIDGGTKEGQLVIQVGITYWLLPAEL